MKRYLDFAMNEIRKPIEALKTTLVVTIEFLALLFLRLVLWFFFFLLPVALLFSLAFHMVTHQVKRLVPNNAASSNPPEVSPLQGRSVSHNPLNLQAINEDVRFWLRELERLRS